MDGKPGEEDLSVVLKTQLDAAEAQSRAASEFLEKGCAQLAKLSDIWEKIRSTLTPSLGETKVAKQPELKPPVDKTAKGRVQPSGRLSVPANKQPSKSKLLHTSPSAKPVAKSTRPPALTSANKTAGSHQPPEKMTQSVHFVTEPATSKSQVATRDDKELRESRVVRGSKKEMTQTTRDDKLQKQKLTSDPAKDQASKPKPPQNESQPGLAKKKIASSTQKEKLPSTKAASEMLPSQDNEAGAQKAENEPKDAKSPQQMAEKCGKPSVSPSKFSSEQDKVEPIVQKTLAEQKPTAQRQEVKVKVEVSEVIDAPTTSRDDSMTELAKLPSDSARLTANLPKEEDKKGLTVPCNQLTGNSPEAHLPNISISEIYPPTKDQEYPTEITRSDQMLHSAIKQFSPAHQPYEDTSAPKQSLLVGARAESLEVATEVCVVVDDPLSSS